MKIFRIFVPFFTITFLSFLALGSFLQQGFFPIHDNTQVQRVFEMSRSLSYGMFPVRWVFDMGYGYGYPIFNFYAPLAYYVGTLIHILGFDALLSAKLMMSLGIILSGISMYLLGRYLFGTLGGALASAFYLFAPFHALNIYVRGDVAEYWAYAFIPFIFYFLLKAFRENKKSSIILGGISYSLVILSHNLTAFMLTPFLVLFLFIYYIAEKKKELLFKFFLIIFLGLGLSAFYIIPVFSEMKYSNVTSQVGGGANYNDHFVCFFQLWDSPWGFGGSTPSCSDGLSFKIGKLHILSSFIGLILLLLAAFKKKKMGKKLGENREAYLFVLFSSLGLLLSIFLLLSISGFVWEKIPFMPFIQYPWRFLMFASFFTSLLSGSLLWILKYIVQDFDNKYKLSIAVFAILTVLLIYGNAKLFRPQSAINVNSETFTSVESLKWITSNITNEYMPRNFKKPTSKDELPKTKIEKSNSYEIVHEEFIRGNIHALISAEKDARVKVNIAYFPAWQGFIDNEKIELKEGEKGMDFIMPTGTHSFDLYFVQTPVEKLGNSISLVFLFVIFIGIIYPLKKKNEKNNS